MRCISLTSLGLRRCVEECVYFFRRIMNFKKYIPKFTRFEKCLWTFSALAVIIFSLFGRVDILNLSASVVGVTALIFVAKGNVWGQVLTFAFAILYAFISFEQRYYGEMITYVGMTGSIAVASVVAWIRHPSEKSAAEVKVATMTKKDIGIMIILSIAVTVAFYFILYSLGTANMFFSTISVTTSFLASYLSYRRIPEYALAYSANDIVLIILWIMASSNDIAYLSMVACFGTFLFNDVYAYFNWRSMKKKQKDYK